MYRNSERRVRTKFVHWPEHHLPYVLYGIKDYSKGGQYRDDYENWDRFKQIPYEIGRLVAANIIAAGLKIPHVRDFLDYRGIVALDNAWESSVLSIGTANPLYNVKP